MVKRSKTKRSADEPSVDLLEEVVSTRVLDAMRKAHIQLTKAGVRHALAGGLAVGAYGYTRATKDVDFLVGEEAFIEHAGGVLTIHPDVPYSIAGVPVDSIVDADLSVDLDDAIDAHGIPVVPFDTLVYMKLKAARRQDRLDLVELFRATNFNTRATRAYIVKIAPSLVALYDDLLAEADE